MNSTKVKKQVIFRFTETTNDLLKAKAREEGLSLQQVAEVLFALYLKNNKEIMKHINTRYEEKKNKKSALDSTERENLFDLIEREYSPLKDFNETLEELKEEDEI